MGQDLGTVNAFPEEGVVLEGRERKTWCTRACQSLSGFKVGLHFLSREVQDALMDQFKERTGTGNATRAGAGFLSVGPAHKSQLPIWKQKEYLGQRPGWDL